MSMKNHLQNRNGTYYFRRVVPEDIRHLFPTASGKPRSEWTWSLRVKDSEQAKRKLPDCLARTNDLIDQARRAVIDAVEEVGRAPSDKALAASQAVADSYERASQDAADFFARQAFVEEMRAAEDPVYAARLERLKLEAEEIGRLRDRRDSVELLAQLKVEA
jgi:hypothetical protein